MLERPKEDWGRTPRLTAEETILWLDGHREFMFEVWRSNPGFREKWLRINQAPAKRRSSV